MATDQRSSATATIDDGVQLNYRPGREAVAPLRLGVGARLRSGTVLYAGATVGERFETGHNVIVRESTTIGDDVSVWSNSVVDYGCRIGDRVKVHTGCYVAQFSELEDDVFLAPGVALANDLFPGFAESAAAMRGPVIEQGAQLGVQVTVLPYVRIGRGAIIGAGAVVSRDIPAGVIAYGCPAVPKRAVPQRESVRRRLSGLPAQPDPGQAENQR
jgi:acetyltransferase-like isoleucine patch superfamily enzyme